MEAEFDLESPMAVCVEFKGNAKKAFLDLKRKLALENKNDVIRYAIVYTEKRTE